MHKIHCFNKCIEHTERIFPFIVMHNRNSSHSLANNIFHLLQKEKKQILKYIVYMKY